MTLWVAVVYGLVYLNQGCLSSPVGISAVQNIMGQSFSQAIFLGWVPTCCLTCD